jgi:hypothetical protein
VNNESSKRMEQRMKIWILSMLFIVGTFLIMKPSIFVSAQICVSNNPDDLDGDSIPNDWELNGMDVNNDSRVDLDLPALGFSPVKKDLGVEMDYMKYHAPYARLEDNAIRAFADTASDSACNPDGTKGINLHFDMAGADEIPHQNSITVYEIVNGTWYPTWSGFDEIKDEWFGNATERSSDNSANILDAKRKIFHYVVSGHTFDNQPNSGISRGIGGMDFLITLGHDSWPKALVGTNQYHSVGTPSIQEGTFMHEFGHNLGLGHGGADHFNNKPNYFSVMNYQLQMPTKVDNRPLDYSQCTVPQINETNLVEKNGIGQSCPPELLMFLSCPPSLKSIVAAGSPRDFSGDGDVNDVNVTADLNCDGETTVLNGYDDWTHIKYITSLGKEGLGLGGISGEASSVPTTQMGLNISQIYNGTSLGEQFDELTYEDIKEQAADKLDAAFIEINKTQQGIAPLESALTGFAGGPLEAIPEIDESGKLNISSIKETYGQVLGTGNVSSLANDTGLLDNTTKGHILSDNIDGAINSTEGVLLTMDSAIGGSPSNDLITNPDDQLRIGRILDSTVDSLKSITCTYSDCSAINQTATNQTDIR